MCEIARSASTSLKYLFFHPVLCSHGQLLHCYPQVSLVPHTFTESRLCQTDKCSNLWLPKDLLHSQESHDVCQFNVWREKGCTEKRLSDHTFLWKDKGNTKGLFSCFSKSHTKSSNYDIDYSCSTIFPFKQSKNRNPNKTHSVQHTVPSFRTYWWCRKYLRSLKRIKNELPGSIQGLHHPLIPPRNKKENVFSPRHRHPQWLPMTGLYSFHCEPIIAVMLISLFNYSAGSHGRAVIKWKICQSERCQSLAARYGHVGIKRYWAHLKIPEKEVKEASLKDFWQHEYRFNILTHNRK